MSEQDYINLCKSLITDRYLLGTRQGQWRQRDLETLARIIEEKSGIKLSLSTLKRLWKHDFSQTPHPATLDAMVSLLDCQDWLEFKRSYQNSTVTAAAQNKSGSWLIWVVVLVALVLVGFLVIGPELNQSPSQLATAPKLLGPLSFTANKTVDTGVPNTVIFKYDVTNLQADSFFIQQSWNEKHRVLIDPTAGNYSSTYYTPGFHRAKLLANDSIFKVSRIHIQTDGWLPLVSYSRDDLIPIYLRDRAIVKGGQLRATSLQLAEAGVDLNRDYTLAFHNVREFDNLRSDNFQLRTRVKCDSSTNYPCPLFTVTIVCEEHIFLVPLTTRGCVGNIGVKFGEVIHEGSNSDLSAFGRDVYNWQELTITVKNKNAQVLIGGEQIYQSSYSDEFGQIMGLVFRFTGNGAVDYLELFDKQGKMVYEDTFL